MLVDFLLSTDAPPGVPESDCLSVPRVNGNSVIFLSSVSVKIALSVL